MLLESLACNNFLDFLCPYMPKISMFSVFDLSFLFKIFEDPYNKTFFHLLGLFKFQSRWPPKGSNDHHPQRPKHATFKISWLSVMTFYPANKTVTHLGDFIAPICGSDSKELKRMHEEWASIVVTVHLGGLRLMPKTLFASYTVPD